ncbi:hypothetical protein ACTFYA_24780 [Escherichia coli]|uniref:hypothetical protein n=1 Tax=Escherichia coli TaxID=562 RepID=UPI003F75F05A
MFTAFNERNDFSYAFEKIRNAISAPGENNLYAATELGLGILLRKYEQFRREPRQPGGCKLKTAPVRPVVAARPAEYVCSEDLFY